MNTLQESHTDTQRGDGSNSEQRVVSKTFCGTCDGVGRVRSNYTTADRGYCFRKLTCPDCKGTGEGDTEYC